jgi:hypothetical protein
MAELPEIKVNIEQSIHARLREAVQSIYDQHGVRVDSLFVSWIGIPEQGRPLGQLVGQLSLQTTSH